MKKNNSILLLGILSISLLIILSIIQSSTAQYPRNHVYNPYHDYYNGYYNPTQGYNYDNNAYSNSDDYYYYEDLDLDVKVPW